MRNLGLIVFALALIFMPAAMAANSMDVVASSLQDKLNTTASDLEKSALEHLTEGNLTQEHISQDINATRDQLKDQIKKEAMEQINQGLNVTAEQLEQKIKDDLKNRVNQQVSQPGFEAIFALFGLLGIALLAGRRN